MKDMKLIDKKAGITVDLIAKIKATKFLVKMECSITTTDAKMYLKIYLFIAWYSNHMLSMDMIFYIVWVLSYKF